VAVAAVVAGPAYSVQEVFDAAAKFAAGDKPEDPIASARVVRAARAAWCESALQSGRSFKSAAEVGFTNQESLDF
jgi:hypothetical protein